MLSNVGRIALKRPAGFRCTRLADASMAGERSGEQGRRGGLGGGGWKARREGVRNNFKISLSKTGFLKTVSRNITLYKY